MIATFALAISPTSYYGGGGYGGGGGGGGGSTPPAATATVSDNGTVTCIADGLKPGSTAQCSIASTPTVLGTITANAQGHAQGTFPLPPGIEAGTHTVTITGIDANGNAVTITTTVTVSAAAAAAASANAGSGTTGTSTSGGAVTASPTVTG
jgi:hypothetical protein